MRSFNNRKKSKNCFATPYEDFRHSKSKSLILLLSLTNAGISKLTGFMGYGIII